MIVKKLLLPLLCLFVFTMCSSDDIQEDPAEEGEIALSKLTAFGGNWSFVRPISYECGSLEVNQLGEKFDNSVANLMTLRQDGSYLFSIGVSEGFVATGKWTFLEKIGEGTYRFDHFYEILPEEIPDLPIPLLKEGTYILEIDDSTTDYPRRLRTVFDSCLDSDRDGFEWSR